MKEGMGATGQDMHGHRDVENSNAQEQLRHFLEECVTTHSCRILNRRSFHSNVDQGEAMWEELAGKL